jgi:hypothetical protein
MRERRFMFGMAASTFDGVVEDRSEPEGLEDMRISWNGLMTREISTL